MNSNVVKKGGNDEDRISGDCISRQQAIDTIKKRLFETAFNNVGIKQNIDETLVDVAENRLEKWFDELPSVQPEPCEDAVSRQAVLDMIDTYMNKSIELHYLPTSDGIKKLISILPSAQPERTCVNCGRTANNGGWYADGGTRCPIEEHYALPKDGYCHLWEKRNVTDDDYPERREE